MAGYPFSAVHLIFRFFTGFCGAAFLSVAGGTVTDLFENDEVGVPMVFNSAAREQPDILLSYISTLTMGLFCLLALLGPVLVRSSSGDMLHTVDLMSVTPF